MVVDPPPVRKPITAATNTSVRNAACVSSIRAAARRARSVRRGRSPSLRASGLLAFRGSRTGAKIHAAFAASTSPPALGGRHEFQGSVAREGGRRSLPFDRRWCRRVGLQTKRRKLDEKVRVVPRDDADRVRRCRHEQVLAESRRQRRVVVDDRAPRPGADEQESGRGHTSASRPRRRESTMSVPTSDGSSAVLVSSTRPVSTPAATACPCGVPPPGARASTAAAAPRRAPRCQECVCRTEYGSAA